MTVVAECPYSKPEPSWFVKLQEGAAYSSEDLVRIQSLWSPTTPQMLRSAMEELYSTLAMQFNPGNSEKVMLAEFKRILYSICLQAESETRARRPSPGCLQVLEVAVTA